MYPYIKRGFDLSLSILLLLFLSPLFLATAVAIKLDSKGPVFFKQVRVGLHKKPFTIYKFRTMHVETPKNVPTGMQTDPERFITRVGRFLRKSSIDELPQLINIIKGEMSIIGPRPVIFEEVQLIEERDRLGVYEILPGVTGLAQINGRDVMEISDKAKIDRIYVERKSLKYDIKLLIRTFVSVLKMEGVVEGVRELSEKIAQRAKPTKKIMMLGNSDLVIYNFRLELVERLLEEGHEVIISSPPGERIQKLVALGCKFEEAEMDRRGTNPLGEFRLLKYYYMLLKKTKPDIVFSYTIKPNIYGALVARRYGIPFVTNITGLGSALENKSFLQKFVVRLYKFSLAKVQTIFFQNEKNRQLFRKHEIGVDKHMLLPGSGVNLEYYQPLDFPSTEETVDFVFVSRIMKEKGIEEYLEAAKVIHEKHPHTRFHIAGFFEEEYEKVVLDYVGKGIVQYHGMIQDVRELFKETHCTILPSYHEGMSNVLLESAACARPILTSNIHGCKEIVDNGITGYCFEPRDTNGLIAAIEEFLALTHEEKVEMGQAGRVKVETTFDRQIIVDNYLNELDKLTEKVFEVQI